MGKSETGAVFLDPNLTSPFEFYQYWLNDDDELVGDHLRWLTLRSEYDVLQIERDHLERPESQLAQRVLADDLTARVHGRAESAPKLKSRGCTRRGSRSPTDS